MGTAVVRDATLADVPALAVCYPPARHEDRIRRADGRSMRYLVVEVEGEVVGFGRLVLVQPANRRRMTHLPQITNLNVRADMRNRGLATMLIQAMERLAQAAGHRALYIGVHRANLQAFSLYKALGYEPVDDSPTEASESVGFDDVRHRGVIHMAKRLVGAEGGQGR